MLAEEQTPYQKLRSLEAIKRIRDGRIIVPLRCGFCAGPTLVKDDEPAATEPVRVDKKTGMRVMYLKCLSCGKLTPEKTAKRLRVQAMRAIIAEGVDLPLNQKKGTDD